MSESLGLVTTDIIDNEGLYLKLHKNNEYIYTGNIRIKNSMIDSFYKPIKCSELYYKIDKFFKWFQYKYLIVEKRNNVEDICLVTKDIPSENRLKPVYELNPESLDNTNKSILTETLKEYDISLAWRNLFNELGKEDRIILNKMIESNEIYLLNNSKSTVDFLSNNTITTELINSNSYTNTVDIKSILGNKIFNYKSFKLDISIKYSTKEEKIFVYDTTICGIKVNNETGKVEYNNFIQKLSHIQLEFLGGIIKVFPIDDNIVDCIISSCLITYGNRD